MAEEYARLATLANGRLQLPALILEDEASEAYDLQSLGPGNHNFSILVELRRSHQTQHAAEGVRTRDSAETNKSRESVRWKLIREMNALLRQDQNRAIGTGHDRKLRWQTPAQGTESSDPGHQQLMPVPTGNSANAATVAALKHQKVPFFLSFVTLPRLTNTQALDYRLKRFSRARVPRHNLIAEARITLVSPLEVGHFAWGFVDGEVVLAQGTRFCFVLLTKLMDTATSHLPVLEVRGPARQARCGG